MAVRLGLTLTVCLIALPSFATGAVAGSGIATRFCDRITATGARMDCGAMVAAHRTLPLGSFINVAHGNKSVRVKIVDRGPAAWTGHVLDLSPAADRALGLNGRGFVRF